MLALNAQQAIRGTNPGRIQDRPGGCSRYLDTDASFPEFRDFHRVALVGQIERSGELNLSTPVHLVMTGSLGTGDLGFPLVDHSITS